MNEDLIIDEFESPKKKTKKKKNLTLQADEYESNLSTVDSDSQRVHKVKKRQTSVFPSGSTDNDSDVFEIKPLSPPKLNNSLKLISEPENEELLVKKKSKKKKKDKLQIDDEAEHYVLEELEHNEPQIEDGNDVEGENEIPGTKVQADVVLDPEGFYEGWPKEDLRQLFERMASVLPKNDSLKFSSRLLKLNWDKIKFDKYSSTECLEKWKFIEKKLRGFRLLRELLDDANAWLEKPWTDFYRSERKNRHPGMPKRPLTSYMLYYMDKKKKFAKKYPNIEMSKLSKMMAEKFNALPESKREKYKRMAVEMREEYNEKMQKFLEEHPLEAMQIRKEKSAGKKVSKPRSGPPKPLSPFKMFYKDKLRQLKEQGVSPSPEFLTECKNKWKSMSSRKKIPWIRWAHEAELNYLEELKLYTAENPNFEVGPYKSILSKIEKEILDRMEGKPEKPPNSAYSLFSRLMLKDPEIKEKFETPKERLQEIARLWKEVPKIEKEEYAEKVKHLLENYKLEYATYLDSLPEDKREEELASNVPKRKPKPESSEQMKKKMRQTTLKVMSKHLEKPEPTPREKEISEWEARLAKKDKRTNIYTIKEIIEMEPPEPPKEPFALFRDSYLKQGLSERKAIKAWAVLSSYEKKNYEQQLKEANQHYITIYRLFLKGLKPEEVNIYSQYKQSLGKQHAAEDEEEEEEEEEQEQDEEEEPAEQELSSEYSEGVSD